MPQYRQLFALVFLVSVAAPASADIYGYVDEDGRAHFSDVKLDSRYEVYYKEAPQPESPAGVDAIGKDAAFGRPAPLQARNRYAGMIRQVAREQKLDAALLHAVVTVESAYNPQAESPRGALGLMQVMPETAARYGVRDLLNPLENLRAGARYLRDLIALFNNNLQLAIAAYNAGEGAVMRAGRVIPPFPETRAYVPRVLQWYERYRAHLR